MDTPSYDPTGPSRIPIPDPLQNQTEKRQINIEPLSRGYVVRVGCQSIAFRDVDEMVELIRAYLKNPEQVEKDYYNGAILPR